MPYESSRRLCIRWFKLPSSLSDFAIVIASKQKGIFRPRLPRSQKTKEKRFPLASPARKPAQRPLPSPRHRLLSSPLPSPPLQISPSPPREHPLNSRPPAPPPPHRSDWRREEPGQVDALVARGDLGALVRRRQPHRRARDPLARRQVGAARPGTEIPLARHRGVCRRAGRRACRTLRPVGRGTEGDWRDERRRGSWARRGRWPAGWRWWRRWRWRGGGFAGASLPLLFPRCFFCSADPLCRLGDRLTLLERSVWLGSQRLL